jgi:hypothetical protein
VVPNPRIAAGSTVVLTGSASANDLGGYGLMKLKKNAKHLLTAEVISTPGISRRQKRERSGRWKESAAGDGWVLPHALTAEPPCQHALTLLADALLSAGQA